MAQILVRYRGGLAKTTGIAEESLEAATVMDLLRTIKTLHGKEAYRGAKSMVIAVNGVSILKQRVFATRLVEGDIVSFFPLAAGG